MELDDSSGSSDTILGQNLEQPLAEMSDQTEGRPALSLPS